MSTDCTELERAFAREYTRAFNITEAAKNSRISRTTAYKYLSFPRVQNLIADEMARRSTRTQLDMDRIIKELAIISQSDITDYFDNPGGRLLTFKELKELPPEQTRCIKSVKEKIDAFGNVTLELTLYDKLKAIKIVAESLSSMINQMHEFMGMVNNPNAGSKLTPGIVVKVLGAPGKTPTLAEWDRQMKELRAGDGNVVDAEYEMMPEQEQQEQQEQEMLPAIRKQAGQEVEEDSWEEDEEFDYDNYDEDEEEDD